MRSRPLLVTVALLLLLLVMPRVARALARRGGRQADRQPPADPATDDEQLAGGEEGSVHLIMSDGSVIPASADLDPEGRLRYLGANLLGEGSRGDS